MTDAELAAWNGLVEGDLLPLADVLRSEDGTLHPVLARWLVKLIDGSTNETDFRLQVTKHPDLKRPTDGQGAKRKQRAKELRTALAFARHGGLEDGGYDSAMAATMEETGLSRATINNHWVEHRRLIKFSLAHGIKPF